MVHSAPQGDRMAAKSGKKKRKVWKETPVGGSGRARCACHYSYPCPRKVVDKK